MGARAGIDSAACDLCDFEAAADAIPGFEHDDFLALAAERSSRAQPGETCTNNHNFGLSGRALGGALAECNWSVATRAVAPAPSSFSASRRVRFDCSLEWSSLMASRGRNSTAHERAL